MRGALVETRAQYVTTIRGLARAAGVLLPTCDTENFVRKLDGLEMDEATRVLVAPLVAMLRTLETELERVEHTLAAIAENDPILQLCATVPGVGLIVAATFVSVIDDAKRFKNAHAVGAYLGLVPSESTTGGPDKRRLGSITKQGNRMARAMLIQAAWTIFGRAIQTTRSRAGSRTWRRSATSAWPSWGSHASWPACSGPCGVTAPSTIRKARLSSRNREYAPRPASNWVGLKPSSELPRSSVARRLAAPRIPSRLRRRTSCSASTASHPCAVRLERDDMSTHLEAMNATAPQTSSALATAAPRKRRA